MTVSAEQRAALARAVSGLRRVFEADCAALAEGKFGIHLAGRRAGEIEDATALSLSAHDLAARGELVGVVEYLQGEGLGAGEAVERMVREAVFTTVNRLLAIRVAEAIGVLPPSLLDGNRSEGFAEAVEAFPLLRDADDSGGYWTYLQICGDELSHAVPRLFDRRHPLSALVPSAEALGDSVGILNDPALAAVWVEPEALGWSYQFFNSQDERRSMREASSAPRDSRELAVRNQFFTPGYVVDFLVQNTLGRRLRESGFGLELPLLLGDVDEDATALDLDDVAVLDPAVGSGHFLLGAYDLLERAWGERGVSSAEAAPRIVRALNGIEIDPRAAQVAQAVIYLRARRSSPSAPVEAPAIVTARPLPRDPETRREVLDLQPSIVRDLLTELSTVLESAPDLGSLLKVEDVVVGALGERVQRPQLGDDLAESIESIEAAVIQAATEIAHRAEATPAERLFAADAADALRFVEACARRYDAVLMNPPFGEPIPGTKEYIKAAWPWIPWKDHNILAAFVGRGLELLKPGGYLGAITSRVGFFLVSYESWREEIVVPRLRAMADLGHGVMEEALVEAAAYVLASTSVHRSAHFHRLLRSVDKEAAMRSGDGDYFAVNADDLQAIPGTPLSYWLSSSLREVFSKFDPLDPKHGTAKVGLQTSDDFRFLRLWWEPPSEDRASWPPFPKGGEYRPFYADIHLVVDWADDGANIRSTGSKPRVQNEDYYLKPGFTWAERTASSISFGPMPRGCIFSPTGPALISEFPDMNLLALLNSRAFRSLLDVFMAAGDEAASGTAARHYTVGSVGQVPAVQADALKLTNEALSIWSAHAHSDAVTDETSLLYIGPTSELEDWERTAADLAGLSRAIDDKVSRAYGLDAVGFADLDESQGPHPASYGSAAIDEADFCSLYALSIDDLVDEAVDRLGGARYLAVKSFFLDRRIELLSHIFKLHPSAVIELRDKHGMKPKDAAKRHAAHRVSYLLGAAFGRWDVRRVIDPSTTAPIGGPFEPLPVNPPGMLIGPDGGPVHEPPVDYPLAIPPDRILHDDPGHLWDVATTIEIAAELLYPNADQVLSELQAALGAADLRSLMRSRFFGLHLSRYTKSRRKAPIYWYMSVPSQEWGLWVYAPRFSREQVFAIARAAQEKLRRLRDLSSQLRRDLESESGREIRDRLETTENLIREIEIFHEKAEAVAQSGWEPDLKDGIILNAAPLEDLFADAKWRKDISMHRKKMENGEYPWATVQRLYFDRLNR